MFTPDNVIAFWLAAGAERWFKKDAAFDSEIRERFLPAWESAAHGQLSSWESSANGTLALILVLDQFPRNMFRDDARAFATDALARDVATRAINRGVDKKVDPALVPFVYMPLMHSESLQDQEHCVRLFSELNRTDSGGGNLRYAKIHADIIRRFGRFPHRNHILGRTTTPEEQAFLESGGFSG